MALNYAHSGGVLFVLDKSEPVSAMWLGEGFRCHSHSQPLHAGRYAYCIGYLELLVVDALTGERRKVRLFERNPTNFRAESHLISLDGRSLYFLQPEMWETEVIVVDFETATITHRHTLKAGLSSRRLTSSMVRADGSLLLPMHRRDDQRYTKGLIRLNPLTGEQSETFVPAFGFEDVLQAMSPDGNYCLTPDFSSLPIIDRGESMGRIPHMKSERLFGINVLLWQTEPLRLIRQLSFGWYCESELPAYVSGNVSPDAIRTTIAEVTTGLQLAPGDFPKRTDFPSHFADDLRAWHDLVEHWLRPIGTLDANVIWSQDGKSLWHSRNETFLWTPLDGHGSQRMAFERIHGKAKHHRHYYSGLEPLGGSRARVWYGRGADSVSAFINAVPSSTPERLVLIPQQRDGWAATPRNDLAEELERRAEAFLLDLRTLRIPLTGSGLAAIETALLALRDEISSGLQDRITDDQIHVVFQTKRGNLSETEFFAKAEALGAPLAPAFRAVMEALTDALIRPPNRYVFRDEEGREAVLHGAARAFARFDANPIPIIKRYGRLVDPEHESAFMNAVIPAMLSNIGWTRDTLDFAVWLIAANYFNSMDHDRLWNAWGMGAAAARSFTPSGFAGYFAERLAGELEQLVADIGPMVNSYRRHAHQWVDILDAGIAVRSQWTNAFFGELRTILPPQ